MKKTNERKDRYGNTFKNRNRYGNSVIACLLAFLCFSTLLTGCQKKPSKDVSIELEEINGSETSAASDETDLSATAEIPRFVSDDEEVQKELEKLNEEAQSLKERYLRETSEGRQFWIRTYVSPNTEVLQCTVCWFEERPLRGDDYNIMTLAYNTKSGEVLTRKNALNSMDISGVQLSIRVGRAFKESEIEGILQETNMQGFATDDDGNVTEVYMKLSVLTEEKEEPVQHFYIYNESTETLTPMSEEGFAMP